MKDLQGIKRLLPYLKRRIKKLLFILFMAVVVAVLDLLPAQIIGNIVDFLQVARMGKMISAVIFFGIVYLMTGVAKVVYGNMVTNYSNSIIEDVRKDLFSAVINRTVTVSDIDIDGDVITRATSDIEQITRIVAGPLNGFIGKILIFVFALVLLGKISIRLSLITILISAVLYFLSRDISVKNNENGREERTYIGSISRKMADVLSNRILIKSYGTEKQEAKELYEQSENVYNCRKRLLLYMTKYWSLVEVCNMAGFVFAFLITIDEILNGRCSIGQIVVIYSYLEMIFSSMISVSRYKTDIFNADAAMERVFSLISDIRNPVCQQNDLINMEIKKIKVENIFLKYEDRVVVDGISFELTKGKLVALEGASGKGKSSIIHAMLGFTDISSGKIYFDELDVTGEPDSRRKFIRAAFQNPYLFQKSLEENLRYGGSEHNWCELFDNMGIDQIVEKKGDQRILDTTNKCLSGGEQRRINIYRSVNKKVPCYIFDEPTAELDACNQQKIIDALFKLKQHSMVLVATHDEELVRVADTVVSV